MNFSVDGEPGREPSDIVSVFLAEVRQDFSYDASMSAKEIEQVGAPEVLHDSLHQCKFLLITFTHSLRINSLR
jgi:hypothetical protein